VCTFQFQPAIAFLIIGVIKNGNFGEPTVFGVSCRGKGVHRGISYPGLSNPSCQSAILDIFSTPPSADPYASRDIGPKGGWLRKGEMSIKILECSGGVQVFGGICAHYSVPFVAKRGGVPEIFPGGEKRE